MAMTPTYQLSKRFLELYLRLLTEATTIPLSDFFSKASTRTHYRYKTAFFSDFRDPDGHIIFDTDGESVWITKAHKEWLKGSFK